MPQDIPLEVSEVLAFTPACLESIEGAPVFRLRATSGRDKRFHRRLLLEEGIRYHDREAIRREVLNGLKNLWDEETFAEQSPWVTDLWQARDDFDQQNTEALKNGEPELKWEYDAELEEAVDGLVRKVSQQWKPLASMIADNGDYGSMSGVLIVAVTLNGFSGLDVKAAKDRGYFTVDTVEAIEKALSRIEKANGLPEGGAWAELIVACSRRMYLTEDEVGNSASPAPSSTSLPPLKAKPTSEPDGKSPELGLSQTETPSTE